MNKLKLNELTLENFNYWPIRIKYYSAAMLAALLALASCWFTLKDNFNQYQQIKIREGDLKKTFEARQKKANLKAYKGQLKTVQEIYKSRIEQVNQITAITDLLNTLTKAGMNSGLSFEFFSPRESGKKGYFNQWSIKLTAVGEYAQFISFFAQIMEFDLLIDLHEFKLKNKQKERLILELKAKIYQGVGSEI